MERSKTLDLAKQSVTSRQAQYGAPSDNFARIALRWNTHLVNSGIIDESCQKDGYLDEADVAIMMADVKLARLENDPTHLDSWVDGAGYMACGAEVSEAGEPDLSFRSIPVFFDRAPSFVAGAIAEYKFGFYVGETVNLKTWDVGETPGIVTGFDDRRVFVRWQNDFPASGVLPDRLRHGP